MSTATTETQIELLPCPCCGSPAEWVDDWHGEGAFSAVSCSRCSMAAVDYWYGPVKPRLIAEWNKRSPA